MSDSDESNIAKEAISTSAEAVRSKYLSAYQLLQKYLVISPENYFFHFWRILSMIVAICSSIMYSFFAAVRKDVEYSGYI